MEPMNASPHHSKVKVSLTLSDPLYVAGDAITGKMEMECRADRGLGIGVMMVELFAVQELTSRDHSATSTFMHTRRLFQGPGLPPSNAVLPHPLPGEPPLPSHHYQARRGLTTFFFRFPLPLSAPASINFGNGLAKIHYEIRASIAVSWKGERRVVTDRKDATVVEGVEEEPNRRDVEAVVVAENGKIWVQGRVVGGAAVAGHSACVELQVKNHSSKKTTGLSLSLTRTLHLHNTPANMKAPLQISDTLTSVNYRGAEYMVPPGIEGVANLVFDVPRDARGVKGGMREGDEEGKKKTESIFEVQCVVAVKVGMGIGSKDIFLDIPIIIYHPFALPIPPPPPDPYLHDLNHIPNLPAINSHPYPHHQPSPPIQPPYSYPASHSSPSQDPYADPTRIWSPPLSHTPQPYQYFSPPAADQAYYFPPPPNIQPFAQPLARPSSADPHVAQHLPVLPSGLPPQSAPLAPTSTALAVPTVGVVAVEPEEGKGERALRVSHHLRQTSRHRSVSPQSHRFPLPAAQTVPVPIPETANVQRGTQLQKHLAPVVIPSTSPVASPAKVSVLSPRPMLSPKQSFSVDPLTSATVNKSEDVTELERIADEVAKKHIDLSSDVLKLTEMDKTLPIPPVPSGKDRVASAVTATRPRADTLFAPPLDETPPTPTLTATPAAAVKFGRVRLTHHEGGLDALERKLLEQVGTRKVDKDDRRADVRSILPIPIPTPTSPADPANDSQISSLALTEENPLFQEKTVKSGSGSEKERGRNSKGTSVGAAVDGGSREKKERKGKGKERSKDGEAIRLRKEAKGRVTAWLGSVDPEVPPSPVETPPISTPDTPPVVVDLTADPKPVSEALETVGSPVLTQKAIGTTEKSAESESPAIVSSAPNPRSSGFVPIGTTRASILQKVAIGQADGSSEITIKARPIPQHVREPVSASPDPKGTFKAPVAPPTLTKPTSFVSKRQTTVTKPPVLPKPDNLVAKKVNVPSPRLPKFPPPAPVELGAKYDARSARGGRGGKVASVAAIWASVTEEQQVNGGAVSTKPKPLPAGRSLAAEVNRAQPVRSPPAKSPLSAVNENPTVAQNVADLTARRARLIKSASVPAALSSSLATPVLSTTASLARPIASAPQTRPVTKLPPIIKELPEDKKPVTKSSSAGELAFGQAKLKDLIKKYQGQTTS